MPSLWIHLSPFFTHNSLIRWFEMLICHTSGIAWGNVATSYLSGARSRSLATNSWRTSKWLAVFLFGSPHAVVSLGYCNQKTCIKPLKIGFSTSWLDGCNQPEKDGARPGATQDDQTWTQSQLDYFAHMFFKGPENMNLVTSTEQVQIFSGI